MCAACFCKMPNVIGTHTVRNVSQLSFNRLHSIFRSVFVMKITAQGRIFRTDVSDPKGRLHYHAHQLWLPFAIRALAALEKLASNSFVHAGGISGTRTANVQSLQNASRWRAGCLEGDITHEFDWRVVQGSNLRTPDTSTPR